MMPARLLRIPLATMAAGAFVLVFSSTTSPLNPRYGADSALFRVIGSALADGQRLYLDVWDHKGPAFFLYQWLAQEIYPGRLGLFCLQILMLTAALLCFDTVASRFGGAKVRVATATAVLAYLSQTFEGGNLTEEFSLVFLALGLMLLTREWGDGSQQSSSIRTPSWAFLVAGASFAIVVFVRLNNALPIFAVFLGFFLVALFKKQRFGKQLAFSLAGFFTVCLAFVASFAASGSLPDMLDASFLFNFRYASDKGDPGAYLKLLRSTYFRLAMLAILTCSLGGIAHFRRTRDTRFLTLTISLSVATGAAVLTSANGFPHYLQIAVPALALGTVLLMTTFNAQAQTVALVGLLVVAASAMWTAAEKDVALTRSFNDAGFAAATNDILEEIPISERGEIYPWTVPSRYYLIAETQPVHRYFTYQEWWGEADPRVLAEAIGFVEETEPKRVLTPHGGPGSGRMIDILANSYQLVKTNDHYNLYERH